MSSAYTCIFFTVIFFFHSHFAPTVATDEFRVVERIKRKCKSVPKLTKAYVYGCRIVAIFNSIILHSIVYICIQ